ncbi:HK97-gp10 family putative phage morphogenesis protein [Numidum massiliense]|uniref:HK97-gp10 family putative phage morphogenesis protein n=1 Tax=Numidum massiliense TaxID=1522315 RepID=UPI0006D5B416|nr:HK97-gp10 family putative phage morphogenesis protein [Numidum massiliense]
MGANVKIDGYADIQKNLRSLGTKAKVVEAAAVKAGGEVLRKTMAQEAPRSASPRQPTSPSQSWRTGQHAADNIRVSRVKTVGGFKIVDVGVPKGDNSPYFYLKFHEYGSVKYTPPKPFMTRAVQSSKSQVKEAIKQTVRKGMGLK